MCGLCLSVVWSLLVYTELTVFCALCGPKSLLLVAAPLECMRLLASALGVQRCTPAHVLVIVRCYGVQRCTPAHVLVILRCYLCPRRLWLRPVHRRD